MPSDIILKLVELGLTEKESQLYYSGIKIGSATVQQLSYESGIKRATVYTCLDSLIEKGLFYIEVVGTRKRFTACSPNMLVSLIDQKKKMLTELLPELVKTHRSSSSNDNIIKTFQGLAGIKSLYDTILNTLSPGDEYLVISDQHKWHNLDSSYFEAFMRKRAGLKLIIRLILQDNEHARRYKIKEDEYGEKIKFLPKHIKMNTNMIILPNRVITLQTVEPLLAILIENSNVTEMNRALFNTIWELSS